MLEELILPKCLNRLHELFTILSRVEILRKASFFRKLENIHGRESAEFIEDRDEVFITRRNLFMLLKTALLEHAEQGIRPVDGLATAVDDGPNAEPICVNLLRRLTLLRVLESIRA